MNNIDKKELILLDLNYRIKKAFIVEKDKIKLLSEYYNRELVPIEKTLMFLTAEYGIDFLYNISYQKTKIKGFYNIKYVTKIEFTLNEETFSIEEHLILCRKGLKSLKYK